MRSSSCYRRRRWNHWSIKKNNLLMLQKWNSCRFRIKHRNHCRSFIPHEKTIKKTKKTTKSFMIIVAYSGTQKNRRLINIKFSLLFFFSLHIFNRWSSSLFLCLIYGFRQNDSLVLFIIPFSCVSHVNQRMTHIHLAHTNTQFVHRTCTARR